MKGHGAYINKLSNYSLIDGIPVATPVVLAIGKGTPLVECQRQKDFIGLEYAAGMMRQYRLNFRELDQQARELLDDIREELGELAQGQQLLQHIDRLL